MVTLRSIEAASGCDFGVKVRMGLAKPDVAQVVGWFIILNNTFQGTFLLVPDGPSATHAAVWA